MQNHHLLSIETTGESFYHITPKIKQILSNLFREKPETSTSGVIHLFIQHTSCALTISESFDPSAKDDLENFMKHLAPYNLSFIKHTSEGYDDSPSHMKSILLNQNLTLLVEKKEIMLGTWQGVYLAEFRADQHLRKVVFKYIPDMH